MSQLSQQELAEFFNLFTVLSAQNLERLSSPAPSVDAASDLIQDPLSSSLPEQEAEERLPATPLQTEDSDEKPSPPSPTEALIQENAALLPGKSEDTTPFSDHKSLEDIWDDYTRSVLYRVTALLSKS